MKTLQNKLRSSEKQAKENKRLACVQWYSFQLLNSRISMNEFQLKWKILLPIWLMNASYLAVQHLPKTNQNSKLQLSEKSSQFSLLSSATSIIRTANKEQTNCQYCQKHGLPVVLCILPGFPCIICLFFAFFFFF